MTRKGQSNGDGNIEGDPAIGRGAALIAGLIESSNDLTGALIKWLTGPSGEDIRICRAGLTALSNSLGNEYTVGTILAHPY